MAGRAGLPGRLQLSTDRFLVAGGHRGHELAAFDDDVPLGLEKALDVLPAGRWRAELARQRDLLLTVWRWYLLPFAPGLVLMFAAMWIGAPAEHQGRIAGVLIMVILLFAAVAIGIVLLNLLAAARLQRMIEDLDRYTEKK